MGNRPALVPKPITINAKARRMSVGSNWSAYGSTHDRNAASWALGITSAALA